MKSPKNPNIAILIVNYKTKKYIIKLLQSYLVYENYNGNIVFYIGDNASWENLEELKTLFPEINIHTYQISENWGFWVGNNFLFQQTTEEIIFLINPDIIWKESILEKLVNLQKHTQAQVIWPRLVTKEWFTQMWDHWELDDIRAKMLEMFFGVSYWKDQNTLTQVSWVSWAAFMINRTVFQNIWGFDESFFLYREEEDLCVRIRNEWWRIYYAPSISMIHLGSIVASMSKYMVNSHILYLKKHHPIIYKLRISEQITRIYFRYLQK